VVMVAPVVVVVTAVMMMMHPMMMVMQAMPMVMAPVMVMAMAMAHRLQGARIAESGLHINGRGRQGRCGDATNCNSKAEHAGRQCD